jgi:glutamate 5-kinase
VPIVNENDAVATDELRFSDNDHLAAMVAPVLDADALILLTDVAGVLDAQGQRISMMDDQGDFVDKGSDSSWGKGGMASKLEAALKARRAGISVVIASAFMPECIVKTMAGEDVGTCFAPAANILRARHHWIAYTLRPRGSLLIDAGAVEALRHGKRSLLPVGVLGLRGEFRRGDAVRIVSASGDEIGRGLCRLSALEVARAAGQKGTDLEMSLGGEKEVVVVHRDDLVVWD